MRMKITALTLVGVAAMAAGAFAQVVVYERHGRHSSFGFGFSLGSSCRTYQPAYYAPAPVATYYTPPSTYYPAYGYHTHHVDSHVAPHGGSTTAYDHFGPVHAPSRATTYYGYPSYGYSSRTYTYPY